MNFWEFLKWIESVEKVQISHHDDFEPRGATFACICPQELWACYHITCFPASFFRIIYNISVRHFCVSFSFACFLLATKIHTVPGLKRVSAAIYLDCVNWSWTWTQLIATELEQTDMKSLQALFPGPLSLKRPSNRAPGAFSMPNLGVVPNQKVSGD